MIIYKHLKKRLIIIVLVVLAGLVLYYLLIYQAPAEIDTERDIGILDTGPHPAEIQLRFEREYNGLKFQDALNLTQKEYESLSKEDILRMQDERFDSWVNLIEHASIESAEETPQ